MRPSLWNLALLTVAAILASGATCNQNVEDAYEEEAPAQGQAQAKASAAAGKAAAATQPPLDTSKLNDAARKEFNAFLSDEFCYCGCPHSVGACLAEHGGCRHARRAATLALRFAEAGYPAPEIIGVLSRYYQSFRAPRAAFTVDPRLCTGNPQAKTTLVEFFDYECPYCAMAAPVLKAFAAKYAANVRLCAVPYPLSGHPNSLPATKVALLARDQGKYWAVHEKLLENFSQLSPELIQQIGTEAGLPAAAVTKVLGGDPYAEELRALRELAKSAGLEATPTLYVNGHKYELDYSEETLQHVVDDELEWSSSGGAWAADRSGP